MVGGWEGGRDAAVEVAHPPTPPRNIRSLGPRAGCAHAGQKRDEVEHDDHEGPRNPSKVGNRTRKSQYTSSCEAVREGGESGRPESASVAGTHTS